MEALAASSMMFITFCDVAEKNRLVAARNIPATLITEKKCVISVSFRQLLHKKLIELTVQDECQENVDFPLFTRRSWLMKY